MNIPEIYQPVQPQPGRMVIPEEYQPEQDPNGKLSKGQHFDQYKKDKAESWWTDFKQIGGNVLPGMGHGVDMVKDANTDKDSFFAGLFKLDPEAYKAAYGGVMTGTHDITRIGKAAISNLMDEFGPEDDEYEREWIRYNQNFDYWTKVRPEYIKSKAFGGEKYGPQKELLSFLDPSMVIPGMSASTHLFQQTVGRTFRAGMKATAATAGVTSRGLGYLGKGVGAMGAAPRKILDKIPGGKAIAGGAYGAGGVALASGAAPVIGGTVAAFGAMDVFGHLAAKVGMEVGEVARVLSTPSGHKRFLQKIATDQAVSPKIRKAAAIAHKLGGTKMGDIIFDTILAGATTASIQAALAKASGATDEEAGAAAGLGVAMGGPMGMALGPRGAGKDVAALNHLGGMTGRSKVSTQGFLEEKAHMVKMEDWKKLPDHSKVLLATLEEIGAGGIKTEIVPGDAYLRFLQEKAAAANKPLPKDTPAAHFDQGLRKIYIDGDNLQRGGREAASVFAHEAGHAFLFDLLGKDPASTRRVLEPFRDDENGKEFWFSFDKDGNGIGDPIKLNKEAVDFAESYAAEAASLGDTSAAVMRDASLLGQEIGAEHFGAMFARNPNVWAAINPGLRQKMGKAAKAVFAAIGLADPVTGNPLPSPWAKKMKANKEINRLFKNHLKFREWQLNQRAEDVSTGTRVNPGKGQTTAAAFTNLYGGMGMSMKDANNFYISDKNMFNELKAVDALVEGSGDPNYVGIGKGKEGKKIHPDMLKLFTFNDPLGNAKAIIDFVQRMINERKLVKFGYRSGSRWKRGEYNPFYERNVTGYAWQVSPKTYSWTGKRKSQPTLKLMGFDADKLAINVEILSQKGLLSEWESPQAFLDALGEHAQEVLAPDGLEGRINPDGIGENSLFAAAFGIEGTAAAPNLRPDLKQLLADGSLKKTLVSYDLPALAGMASENKPGYAFDYRHIRDNYMPKMAGLGDIATVNKHTPQRTPEPVTLFKQPPATGVDRLLFAPKENLAKREKPEVNKLILEMDGAEAAMKDLNERRGRAATTSAMARTREAVTLGDARRRREARGEPLDAQPVQPGTMTQPGVEKADLVTVLPMDHRNATGQLPPRNERVEMSTSEAIKWGEAGEIDKVFFDGKSTPWDEARPLLMEKAGGENSAAMQTFLDGLYQHGQGRVDAVSRIFRTITEEYADDAFKLGSVPKNLKDKSLHNLVKIMGKGKVDLDVAHWPEVPRGQTLGSIMTKDRKSSLQFYIRINEHLGSSQQRMASIGTSNSKMGGGGGHLYAIFYEFLAQNDIVNTGEGLSAINEFRRLSNATGSALRHGTTKHVNVSQGESMGITDKELAVLPSASRAGWEGGHGLNAKDIILARDQNAPPSLDQMSKNARSMVDNELELGHSRMPFDEPGEMGVWKYGEDFNRDIAGRLIGELYEVDSRLSDITRMYEYDFDSGKFSRKGSGEGTFDRTGGTISAKEMVEHIENVASQTERPGYHETDATYGKGNWSHGVGLSTLRRAIITRNALERAETYGRATDPDLLKPKWHKEGKGLPEDMQDIFYSPKTPEFKKWFGDSKVVDKDGSPLRVHHGSAIEIREFKHDHGHPIVWNNAQKELNAFFFTGSKDVALSASFAAENKYRMSDKFTGKTGHHTAETFLSIKNPKRENITFLNKIEEEFTYARVRDYKKKLLENGHDGIIFKGKHKGKDYAEYAVFDPTQIKSTSNRGTFDSANPDIFYIPKRNMSKAMALEVIPGESSGFMDKVRTGPMNVKLEWHQRHMDVLTNDKGEFLPAQYLGIDSKFENFPSAYVNEAGQLEINPVAMLELLGAKRGDVELMASVLGRLTFQEAVAGYNRSYAKPGEHDGFHVKVGEGRNISEQEMATLQKALFKQLGPAAGDLAIFPHLAGFDVKWLGYNDLGVTKDVAFDAMTQGLDNVLAKTNESYNAWDFHIGDTVYEGNNWKQFPNGEQYLERTRSLASRKTGGFLSKQSRRSTFAKWVDAELAPGLGEIHSDFQARGLGNSGAEFVTRHKRRAAPDSVESKGGFLFETTHHHAEARPGELSVAKKSIDWKQEHWDHYKAQGKLADDTQRALPDAGANPEAWKEIFQTRLEGVEGAKLPVFASRLGEWVNNPQELAKVISEAFQKNPDLVRKSKEGIEAAREMHQVAREGRLANEAVASSFFWGFLSRMLDPYNQEAGWLRMTSKVGFWKQLWKSVDGTFDMPRGEYWTGPKAALEAIHGETNIKNAALNVEIKAKNKLLPKHKRLKLKKIHEMKPADFSKLSKGKRKKYTRIAKERNLNEQPGTWVDLVANTFEKQNTDNFLSTGQNATQNINGAYDLFQKWNGRWDDVTAVLNDAELTGPQMREKFWEMGLEGAGIGDKVTSFVIATLARGDVLILDRWQFVNLWLNEIGQAAKNLPGRVMEKAWAAKEAAGKARRAGDTAGVSKQKAKMRELREQFNDWKEHGGNPFRMDSRGVPEDRSNFYDTVGSKAEGVESHALYRNLENIFDKLSNDLSQLTPELSWLDDAFSLHWLTWNIIKDEAVGHSSLEAITHMSKNDLFPNDKSKRGAWLRSFFGADKFTERLWAEPGKPKRTQRFSVTPDAKVRESSYF
jgi:hypothetical protein